MSVKKKTNQNKAMASGLQAMSSQRWKKQLLTVLVNKHTERDAVGVESI